MDIWSFKPYYKWITFNTYGEHITSVVYYENSVLNLIINGLPSIQKTIEKEYIRKRIGFKPYYKWITFNTEICIRS